MTDSEYPKRTARLPAANLAAFVRLSKKSGGPPATTIAYMWLADAVQRARAGLPLPPADSVPAGPTTNFLWTQTRREFDQWGAELEAAGSSIRAVLSRRMVRFVETGGDPLAAVQEDDPAVPVAA